MTTAAVILAGGRGTRSANPTTAKIAQEIGSKSLLQWHLELLSTSSVDEVLLVTAHLANQVQHLASTVHVQGLNVRLVREANPRGTFPALQAAALESNADHFLVILGDVWTRFPVDDFLHVWQTSKLPVATIIHPSLHPHDSDAVIPQPNGNVKVVAKTARTALTRNMSSTGIFGVRRNFLGEARSVTDIGSELLPEAAARNQLFTYVSSHYFKDTGTPTRLEQAHADWLSGAFARRGRIEKRPGVIVDRDGVLNPCTPEIYRPEDMRLIEGVDRSVGWANSQGVPIVVATNQPGLAKGFMTFKEHEAIRARLDSLLIERGAFLDDYAFCPHHPERGFSGELTNLKIACDCRKPAPGLLKKLIRDHRLDPNRTIMVGDSDRDEQAAAAAGIGFSRVQSEDEAARQILASVERVMC